MRCSTPRTTDPTPLAGEDLDFGDYGIDSRDERPDPGSPGEDLGFLDEEPDAGSPVEDSDSADEGIDSTGGSSNPLDDERDSGSPEKGSDSGMREPTPFGGTVLDSAGCEAGRRFAGR
jgi:hypothetical protein